MFKKSIVCLMTGLFTFSSFATAEGSDIQKQQNTQAEIKSMQMEIDKKRDELWKEYLKEKSDKELKESGVMKEIPDSNSTPNNVETENQGPLRFTCLLVKNIGGSSLNEKTNYKITNDSISKDVVFAVENDGRGVYINDGVGTPFIRTQPNIMQRYMKILDNNEIFDTWVFDFTKKKALFTQSRTGEDIGISTKAMVGDIDKMITSDDCSEIIQ